MKTIQIDDELKSIIPPLSDDEKKQLEANIIENGCRDPLVIWQGVLVDGHNRYEICTKHGIEFKTVELDFESKIHARIWMRNNQKGRRNLTPAWKIDLELGSKEDLLAIGKAKHTETVGRPNKEKSLSPNDNNLKAEPKHNTRVEIAKAAGASTGQVGMAEQVKKKAPELWEKAKQGDVSISAAYKEVKKKDRAIEIAENRKAIADKTKNIQPSERFLISLGDLATYSPPEPVDVIITDPPYPREFLPLWETLAKRAIEWLKPGGIVVAMSGQAYLDQVYAMMSKHLDYYWTACYHTPGQPTPLRQVNVNTTWKPLLIYCRKNEKFAGKIFGDFMASDKNEKDFHKWGQSVSGMDEILKRFALPGQSVLDPFCGAGTTGIAAVKRGCIFYGCEIEQQNVDISISRIAEAAG